MKHFPALIAFAIMSLSVTAQAETPIPRSVAGDKGKYFLMESQKKGSIVRALHKRVGTDGIAGYTRTETNCSTMQMREIGYSEESPAAIKENPTQWSCPYETGHLVS
ncbi:MAG: hypothetical protein ACOY3Z_06270 [Thermodesulfobacteriota bacterium]